jgi:hypothetical protein
LVCWVVALAGWVFALLRQSAGGGSDADMADSVRARLPRTAPF